jgi:hypothetical protein
MWASCSVGDGVLRLAARSVALLLFTRNNLEEAVPFLTRWRSEFGEAVVIDSSDPPGWTLHGAALVESCDRVVRAIPTGYQDLLLPFGVAAVRSEWTFHCDPDEEPTPALLARLAALRDESGAIVPRFERSLRAYTYHLRVFRTSAFVVPDPAYAYPQIAEPVVKFERREHVIHSRVFGPPLSPDYLRRVMDLESMDRPPDTAWLRSLLPFRRRTTAAAGSSPEGPVRLGRLSARVGVGLAALQGLRRTGSMRFARYQLAYHRARVTFFEDLSEEERERRGRITAEYRSRGGMIGYLGLESPARVGALTRTFSWDVDGLTALHRLLAYRYEQGRPMETWTVPRSG